LCQKLSATFEGETALLFSDSDSTQKHYHQYQRCCLHFGTSSGFFALFGPSCSLCGCDSCFTGCADTSALTIRNRTFTAITGYAPECFDCAIQTVSFFL